MSNVVKMYVDKSLTNVFNKKLSIFILNKTLY